MVWPSTTTSPVLVISVVQHAVLSQPPHQHAGAPVDETFRQTLVQRIGKPVLDRAGNALPMIGVAKPVRPVRGEGPGPDVRDPRRKRVDVAVDVIGLCDLAGKPIV